MFATTGPEISPIWFVPYFAGLWLGVTGLLGVLGGWFKLSKSFRDMAPPEKPHFTSQSIMVGIVNYGRCVDIQVAADGLHLKIFLLFRLMHSPLLIPWSEIISITPKKWLFFTSYQIVIGQTGTKIRFYGKAGEAIFKEWKKRSPAPKTLR